MHIPDGFINAPTAVGAAIAAAGGLGGSLRAGARRLADRQIPVAGLAAAFVFVLQMLNFPVAAGTTGHLLGGAVATVLLGPALGITVVAVVVIVQALLFADGGVSALGLNVLNMAVVTSLVAWGSFRLVTAIRSNRAAVVVGTMVAGWMSVVASSMAFALEYAVGGRGGVDPSTVFGAMVGVHALIGIGEGLISATVIGSVLAVRPDLVWGAQSLAPTDRTSVSVGRRTTAGFVAAGLAAAVALVVFVAPNAASDPDGLERVAEDTGFAQQAGDPVLGGPFADYAFQGREGVAGTIVAGLVGMAVTFGVALVLAGTVRRMRREASPG